MTRVLANLLPLKHVITSHPTLIEWIKGFKKLTLSKLSITFPVGQISREKKPRDNVMYILFLKDIDHLQHHHDYSKPMIKSNQASLISHTYPNLYIFWC